MRRSSPSTVRLRSTRHENGLWARAAAAVTSPAGCLRVASSVEPDHSRGRRTCSSDSDARSRHRKRAHGASCEGQRRPWSAIAEHRVRSGCNLCAARATCLVLAVLTQQAAVRSAIHARERAVEPAAPLPREVLMTPGSSPRRRATPAPAAPSPASPASPFNMFGGQVRTRPSPMLRERFSAQAPPLRALLRSIS